MRLLKVVSNPPDQTLVAPTIGTSPSAVPTAAVGVAVNGAEQTLDVRITETLAETLRQRLGLTGTKLACDDGCCGSCTVLLDGAPVYACMLLTLDCDGREVLTIEGLGDEARPHPLQVAFAETYAAQCGFCTPGAIMAAKALLDRTPAPTEADVRLGLSGVICRCGYSNIIAATLQAASALPERS
jgi:carbon-monoxide dehydrogenase small subunit